MWSIQFFFKFRYNIFFFSTNLFKLLTSRSHSMYNTSLHCLCCFFFRLALFFSCASSKHHNFRDYCRLCCFPGHDTRFLLLFWWDQHNQMAKMSQWRCFQAEERKWTKISGCWDFPVHCLSGYFVISRPLRRAPFAIAFRLYPRLSLLSMKCMCRTMATGTHASRDPSLFNATLHGLTWSISWRSQRLIRRLHAASLLLFGHLWLFSAHSTIYGWKSHL